MLRVLASDFGREFDRYQDAALREPVMVTREGRDVAVLISAEEFRRLKRRDRRAVSIDDFTEEEITAIAAAEFPAGYERLDEELKDWVP
jgi:prevent-host-death family protein